MHLIMYLNLNESYPLVQPHPPPIAPSHPLFIAPLPAFFSKLSSFFLLEKKFGLEKSLLLVEFG